MPTEYAPFGGTAIPRVPDGRSERGFTKVTGRDGIRPAMPNPAF